MNNVELDCGLFEAVKSGNLAAAKDFIQQGAGVNIVNQQGRTLLWSAMCGNNKEIIGLLLENGANIDFTERYFRAALSIAENDIKKMVITTAILRGIEKPARNRTTEELSSMWDACGAEALVLQKEIILGTTSLWDLCKEKDENKLVTLFKHEEVKNKFNEDFRGKYSYFGANLNRGMLRARALDTALKVIFSRNENKHLDEDCWRKTLKKLDITSLRNVNNSIFFKSPIDDNSQNDTKQSARIRRPGL